ncbi:MAG: methylenetetrahydrofolate reductase [NAD(P)H] [Candidatus Omnitrophica bacterium]|jgi:methylenetetrahydrofolate reductase (NADPH)|nr:methylenetetrahydrofolate reductase [NAD(P)H] [Candidatus Omnitrophota bacterium]
MKIIDILKTHDKGVSFEFFPPKTENGMNFLMNTARELKAFKPLYVSMTYGAAGSTQEKTKEATFLLIKEKDFVVMPHLTCIGANVGTIKTLLSEYKQNGIENIMALRGDIPQNIEGFNFKSQALCYAKDLVGFIKENGKFCTGVAVYPEGHIETKTLDEDIEYTKQKIDAGADFAVTQMFFDNSHFYNFLERAGKKGINIPVLPGIFPLTDIDKLKKFCAVARTTVPKKIEEEMSRFRGNSRDMEKCGIDFTIKQCRDLISHGYSHLHFFTFNKSGMIRAVLNAIF